MKIVKALVSVFLALMPATSFAEVIVSYTYKFKPESLQKLYDGLVEAQQREPQDQDLLASVPIFDGNLRLAIQGICPPHQPDIHGNGCSISALQDPKAAIGQISVSIRKPVVMSVMKSKLTEISASLSSKDPNTFDGHLNLGNVFYRASDDAKGSSDYVCASEGATGAKSWQCYLTVRERL